MITEIEVKVLEVNKEAVVAGLLERGGERLSAGEVVTMYFDRNDEIKSKKAVLRLRSKGEEVVLCFKKVLNKGEVKTAEEVEVKIDNQEEMVRILQAMGFESTLTFVQNRETYRLGRFVFEFDSLPGIPTFLEIEGPSEKEVLAICKDFDFPEEQIKSWTVTEVFSHYGKNL